MHDELVFEVPEAAAPDLMRWVKNETESVYKLAVPLVVDVGSGQPGAPPTSQLARCCLIELGPDLG